MPLARSASGFLQRVRDYLPEGRELPPHEWRARHRQILLLAAAHVAFLIPFGFARGWGAAYSLGEPALVAALAGLAWILPVRPRIRSSLASVSLATASAILVQFSGGSIEAHFHYFIVVAVVALYHDWVPFLLTVLYVLVEHGLIGQIAPTWVYNHHAALLNPWKWAAIHAALILMECAALTAQWRASERSRAHAELVLQSTEEGILGLDAEGRVAFANGAAQRLTRHPHLVGTPAANLFLGEFGPESRELRLRSDARVALDVVANPSATRSAQRSAQLATVLVVKDADARREQETRLRAANQALVEADRVKREFMNAAAHELRTPLTPVLLQLDLLSKVGLSEPAGKSVATAQHAARRLHALVEEVLQVVNLDGARGARDAFDLAALTRSAVEGARNEATRRGVTVATETAATTARGDPGQVGRALAGMVESAVRTAPRGSAIEVHCGPGARVTVTAPGLRMPPGEMFEPFGTHANPEAGSGLGLYLAQRVAHAHGGQLVATSQGRGIRLQLTLPE